MTKGGKWVKIEKGFSLSVENSEGCLGTTQSGLEFVRGNHYCLMGERG